MAPTNFFNFWNSIVTVILFSFVVIFLDEWILKPWRQKRWEREAASGNKEKQELLRLAKQAQVPEE